MKNDPFRSIGDAMRTTVATSATLSLPQLIDRMEIASPCEARWEDMVGDERSRRCAQCELNVHNLEAMTPEEIRDLILNADGRVCGRVRRRMDGTVITRDCPVGLARLRRAVAKSAMRMAAAAVFVVAATIWFARAAIALRGDSIATVRESAWQRTKTWLGQDQSPATVFLGRIASPPGRVTTLPRQNPPTPSAGDCDEE